MLGAKRETSARAAGRRSLCAPAVEAEPVLRRERVGHHLLEVSRIALGAAVLLEVEAHVVQVRKEPPPKQNRHSQPGLDLSPAHLQSVIDHNG
jgi:hypothetical protein